MISRTPRRSVPMMSLRDLSGSSLGRNPTRASRGSVSSRIRPLDNAMLITPMRSSLPASVHPRNSRAQPAEFLLERFVAAVQVVNAVDHGLALRSEAREHEARPGAQGGRHHLRTGEPL